MEAVNVKDNSHSINKSTALLILSKVQTDKVNIMNNLFNQLFSVAIGGNKSQITRGMSSVPYDLC